MPTTRSKSSRQSNIQNLLDLYLDALKADSTNTFKSLKEMKDSLPSPFSSSSNSVIGIVKEISSGMTHFSRQQKFKRFMLIDPTTGSRHGTLIDVVNIPAGTFIEIGNITLLKGVEKKRRTVDDRGNNLPQSQNYYEVESKECFEYPALQYNWQDDIIENENDNFIKNASVSIKNILQVLEEWFAKEILSHSLSQMPSLELRPIKSTQSYAAWIPCLLGEVVKQQLMELSDVMTVWDGTLPSYPVRHPYQEKYAAIHPEEAWNSIETTDENVKKYAKNLFVDINVFRNYETSCPHWNKCNSFRCNDSGNKDFLLLFNVEVRSSPVEALRDEQHGKGFVDLILRSGQHRGKGVKIVKFKSILGRLFRERLDSQMANLIKEQNNEPNPGDG